MNFQVACGGLAMAALVVGCLSEPFTAGVALSDAGPEAGAEGSAGDSSPGAESAAEAGSEDARLDTGDAGPGHDAAPEAAPETGSEPTPEAGLDATPTPEAGTDAAPEASTGDGCVLTTHTNGLGQSWQDCEPLGTYTMAEAAKACAAYYGSSCVAWCTLDPCIGYVAPYQNYCWTYGGDAGVVAQGTSMSSSCQRTATGTWE